MSKIRTGILGGSFDPVHNAHLELAKAALEGAGLEEIFFIPAKQAPLRDSPVSAPDADRLAMLRLALKKFHAPHKISLFEMNREGISYSIDTARHLAEKYPHRDFFWIIGSDHLEKLKHWKDIGELANIVSFVCAARPGYEANPADIPQNVRISYISISPMPHSSTQIRENLKNGGDAKFMLDGAVLEHIIKNKLYNT